MTIYQAVDENQYEAVQGSKCPLCDRTGEVKAGMVNCPTCGWIVL